MDAFVSQNFHYVNLRLFRCPRLAQKVTGGYKNSYSKQERKEKNIFFKADTSIKVTIFSYQNTYYRYVNFFFIGYRYVQYFGGN